MSKGEPDWVGMQFRPEREAGDGKDVSFKGWEWENEYQRLAMMELPGIIEQSLRESPPDMSVGVKGGDVVIAVSMPGLAAAEVEVEEFHLGPTWRFSLREALDEVENHARDGVVAMARALREIADDIEKRARPAA
jgi:hypothetical protein